MSQIWVPWQERRRRYEGLAGLIAGGGRAVRRFAGPLLKRFAPLVFSASVIGAVVGIWLIAALVVRRLRGPGWPAVLHDVIVAAAVLGFVTLVAMYCIWWERKVAGRIQSRLGPMRTGGWHGWAQSLADGIKCLAKEDAIPAEADQVLFRLAPYLAFVPAVCALVALPFGAHWVFRDMDAALVLVLGLIGVEIVGILVAGWASASKWTLLGSMRQACQVVSYEIPMGMALLIAIMCAGTLRLSQIGQMQSGGWFSWLAFRNPFTFAGLFVYFIASLASCKRLPFDLPEAESELVGGYHTEYSGFRWAVFFFGEYTAMFVVSALATLLFLGGWHSPLPTEWGRGLGEGWLAEAVRGLAFGGPLWFIFKCAFLIYAQLWLRWTLPRLRIDQVLYACVQVLLPLAMLLLLGNTVWEVLASPAHPTFAAFARAVAACMGLLGAVLAGGFVAIALYGWVNRRRLVGRIAVEHLPGA